MQSASGREQPMWMWERSMAIARQCSCSAHDRVRPCRTRLRKSRPEYGNSGGAPTFSETPALQTRLPCRAGIIDNQWKDALMISSILARSEEHTSELQSLMRISYAVFCLKKNNISIPRPEK